ncbi:exodeoxyribonuclease III, partial [Acidobacteriota bacterium]
YTPDDPIVILGDFNVAHKDIDVYSPAEMEGSISVLPEERAIFDELLDWNLVDAFRSLHPDKIQFTWWDYIGGAIWKDQGLRIDYILCTKTLQKKIKDIKVDLWPRKRQKPTPSDHAPLIAEF